MALTSYHAMAIQGVANGIIALNLVPAANVYQQTLVVDYSGAVANNLPAIYVTEANLQEILDPDGVLMNTDDVGYPVGVTIVTARNNDSTVQDADLFIRQATAEFFHRQAKSPLNDAIAGPNRTFRYTLWEPGQIVSPELWKSANLWVSCFIVRVVVRKTRP